MGSNDQHDTGSAGFEIDGKTYSFDVGRPGEQAGNYGPYVKKVNVDPSFIGPDGKPKDVSKSTRTTLGKYLSDVTLAKKGSATKPNRFPITPTNAGETKAITDTNGAPVGPAPASSVNANNFGGKVDPYSPQFPVISSDIQKGKAPSGPNAKDGHDFLKGEVNADSSPIGRYRSAVMSNNRFTNAQGKSFTDGGGGSDAGFNPALGRQTTKGTFVKEPQTLTPGRMASIGPLLTMRAGKELTAAAAGTNPNSAGAQAAALLPGLGQLGVTRIEPEVLTAADVLVSLTTDEIDSAFVINPSGLSWGQLNNVNDPYSGTSALGMLALSTALVAGVELVIDALSLLLGMITPSLKKPARDAQGRYTLGEYLPGSKAAKKQGGGGLGGAISAVASLNFGALLGIQATHYPFNRALTSGMNAFFGIPDDVGGGIGLNQLAGAVTASIDSPGFNVVVARAIIRSSLTIIDQLKKIGGNVMNAVTQILALIDTIKNSKLIAACNIFANLGDAILSMPKHHIDADSGATKISGVDADSDDDPSAAVRKNRLKGTLKLAWASNRAAANLLLPASIAGNSLIVKDMGQFSPFLGIGEDGYSKITSTVTTKEDMGRIKTEDALKFEQELEASYVPFYFHDVRTNEMVSFHAFLASLSDDYTANYDKSEGFGRVEAVKIYKSTERKIGMSFYVVATSMLDLDEMYVKLNKLVTLVYPQYTQGITLVDKDDKYSITQPFSQLIGASPLVRIRLGDLIRSNYSLFALGRLFGMGNPDFKVDGESFIGESAIDKDKLIGLAKALKTAQENPNGEIYWPQAGYYDYIDAGALGGGLGLPLPKIPLIGGGDGPKFNPHFLVDSGIWQVKVKKVHPDNPKLVIGEVSLRDDDEFKEKYKKAIKGWQALYGDEDKPLTRVIEGTYVFPVTSLTPTPKTKSELMSKLGLLGSLESSNSEYSKKLGEFLSHENNAVAKSFRDTGGKGLAGFIESMSFDWYDKTTWEVESGKTAPKMCKVTINFSPIHDISPGIDHLGFNRAPIYPVGLMGQSKQQK